MLQHIEPSHIVETEQLPPFGQYQVSTCVIQTRFIPHRLLNELRSLWPQGCGLRDRVLNFSV
jgi:hypothetical protein